MLDFGDILDVFHVGSVTARTKDTCDPGLVVDVVGSNQRTSGIVDNGNHLDGKLVLIERLAEHGSAITAFGVGVAESFGPSYEPTVVDLVLLHGVTEGEAESKLLFQNHIAILVSKVVLDESSQAISAKVEKLGAVGLLLFLGETELGLSNLELAGTLEDDVADSQIGSTQIEGKVRSDLVT